MNRLLYNPFETIPDKKLLLTGIIGTVVFSLLAWLLNCRFAAYITVTPLFDVKIYEPLLDNIAGVLTATIVLFMTGLAVNKKTRFIDILNAAMIARLPFYLNIFDNINNYMARQTEAIMAAQQHPDTMNPTAIAAVTAVALAGLLLLVWMSALLYNGFRVAANTKKVWHIVLFVVAVLVAHFASGYVIYVLPY
ncbi:MAG: hypothetical protein ACLGH8_13040 [Bacteroidia bacterium]